MSAPIIDDEQHVTIGAVTVLLRRDTLFHSVSEATVGQTGHAMLFNSDGVPLICPVLAPEEHAVKPELVSAISASPAGWTTLANDSHGGQNSIVGFAPVRLGTELTPDSLGGKRWVTFVRQDPAESYAPLSRLVVQVTVYGLGVFGAVSYTHLIQERISGGRAQITGTFSMEEANNLSIVLRAGALPAPLKIIQDLTVGPSLGQDSIEKGVKATLFAGLLVIVFMALYYRLSGVIANFALLLNLICLIGALAGLNATLTLPGIAGIILTIGMGVDSNVLIFERIREELRQEMCIRDRTSSWHSIMSWHCRPPWIRFVMPPSGRRCGRDGASVPNGGWINRCSGSFRAAWMPACGWSRRVIWSRWGLTDMPSVGCRWAKTKPTCMACWMSRCPSCRRPSLVI